LAFFQAQQGALNYCYQALEALFKILFSVEGRIYLADLPGTRLSPG
jgi:hypothetical protein